MPKKILLVDNNHEYRHVLASIVRRVGYEVIHAAEIADAVKRLVSDRPALVMIGDGVEIAGLKSNQFSVRIPWLFIAHSKPQIGERKLCRKAPQIF
jgi:CheY-like chemotaxis protein